MKIIRISLIVVAAVIVFLLGNFTQYYMLKNSEEGMSLYFYMQGTSFLEKRDTEMAKIYYIKAIAFNPSFCEAYSSLGEIYMMDSPEISKLMLKEAYQYCNSDDRKFINEKLNQLNVKGASVKH